MFNKIIIFSFLIILSFNLNGSETDDYKLKDKDVNDIYEFATLASIGIIFHEIGHLVIDELNVPIFNNEEDVADSFMAWYLIHTPDNYETRENYEEWSEQPHKVIKAISDFYYYRTLLGEDYSDTNEYGNHSTDNKRFFNIACFMKGANPEVFDSYITKRNLSYILDGQCNYNYYQMDDAWWNIVEGNKSGKDGYQFWTLYPYNSPQKININFDYTDDSIFTAFKSYSEYTILDFLESFQVLLENEYSISFEYCDGDVNAYYISADNKILVCYELIESFLDLKYEIILLKNSL